MITLNDSKARDMINWTGKLTFMTTFKPLFAKIAGANSEPLYASRLYRALVANSATAGGFPMVRVRTFELLNVKKSCGTTISFLK